MSNRMVSARTHFMRLLLLAIFASSFSTSPALAKDKQIHIITPFYEQNRRGEADVPFWQDFQQGVEHVKRKYKDIKVTYNVPVKKDTNVLAELISTIINKRPDGIILSIQDHQKIAPVIKQLQESQIPFFTVATPENVAYEIKPLLNIGEEGYQTGQLVGQFLKNRGAKYGMCVLTSNTDVRQLLLCNGFIRGFGGSSKVTRLQTSTSQAQRKVQQALLRDTRIDSIFIITPDIAPKLIQRFVDGETLNRFHVVAADTSREMVKMLKYEGARSLYAVTNQPYLQAYSALSAMQVYLTTGMLPARNLLTSPHFVDKQMIEKYPKLLRQ